MRALVDALLRDLQVSLTDISLCYGATVGGPAVSLRLPSLHLRCQRRQAVPRLLALCFPRKFGAAHSEHSCDCTLEMVIGIDWHPNGLLDGNSESSIQAAAAVASAAAAAAAAGSEKAIADAPMPLLCRSPQILGRVPDRVAAIHQPQQQPEQKQQYEVERRRWWWLFFGRRRRRCSAARAARALY